MKKFLFTLTLALAGLAAHAQSDHYPQGSWLLTGYGSYSTNDSEIEAGGSTVSTSTASPFLFGVQGGYFITDRIALGLQVDLAWDDIEGLGGTTELREQTVWAFGRYYRAITDDFGVFGQLSAGFVFGSADLVPDGGGSTQEASLSGFTVAVQPGLYYYIGERTALELRVGNLSYASRTREDDDTGVKTTNEGFSSSFSFLSGLSLGVSFTLGGN